MKQNKAIGVFDSGVGGLTVVRHLQKQFPNENIIYFGDTARVPYGTKSADTIVKFSLQDSDFLHSKDIKCIVIACNTASAYALEAIQKKYSDMPVVGMIKVGAESALKASKNNRVGIIATAATVNSNVYRDRLIALRSSIFVESSACPLFVPLVEEGFLSGEITDQIVMHYLTKFTDLDIDTLILGCTHYPLLKDAIEKFLPAGISLIDSGEAAAVHLKKIFENENLSTTSSTAGVLDCYLSSPTVKFNEIADRCLMRKARHIEIVDIEKI